MVIHRLIHCLIIHSIVLSPSSYFFPPQLAAALEEYVCVMGAKPNIEGGPLTNWWRLERCVFVPRKALSSGACGGLRLVQNATAIVGDSAFCDKNFGRTHYSMNTACPSCMQDGPSCSSLNMYACVCMCAQQVTAWDCRSLPSAGFQ